jgi:radical SAM protein with 4Fe4S-binding SPASM domain
MIDKVLNVSRLTHVRISLYDMAQWDKWKSIKHPKLKFFNMTGKEINGITTGYISSAYGVDHKRALKDFNKTDFCSAPFYFITINTDGSVVPCYSFDEIGNISDGFLRLWNGYKIRQYRRKAVNGRNIILADCDNCGINYRYEDG